MSVMRDSLAMWSSSFTSAHIWVRVYSLVDQCMHNFELRNFEISIPFPVNEQGRFECDVCGKSFLHNPTLKKHKKEKHDGKGKNMMQKYFENTKKSIEVNSICRLFRSYKVSSSEKWGTAVFRWIFKWHWGKWRCNMKNLNKRKRSVLCTIWCIFELFMLLHTTISVLFDLLNLRSIKKQLFIVFLMIYINNYRGWTSWKSRTIYRLDNFLIELLITSCSFSSYQFTFCDALPLRFSIQEAPEGVIYIDWARPFFEQGDLIDST